jgi:hypothetical protein
MNNDVFFGFSRIYSIIEMHGSRIKIPSKNSRQAALAEGFNSGVKGLSNVAYCTQ